MACRGTNICGAGLGVQAKELLTACRDAGVNFFDNAEVRALMQHRVCPLQGSHAAEGCK